MHAYNITRLFIKCLNTEDSVSEEDFCRVTELIDKLMTEL